MFLDDLVEAGIVQLNEFGEIVDVRDNITEVFLEKHKLLLAGAGLVDVALVEAVDDIANFSFADCYAPRDLHGLHLLLRVDLLELLIQLADEACLVILGPLIAAGAGLGRGTSGILELALEAIVVDVVPPVLADDAGSQLLAELHDDDARGGSGAAGVSANPGLVSGCEVTPNQHGDMKLRASRKITMGEELEL